MLVTAEERSGRGEKGGKSEYQAKIYIYTQKYTAWEWKSYSITYRL